MYGSNVADADQVETLLVPFRDTDNHVLDQCSSQAVQSAALSFVVDARYDYDFVSSSTVTPTSDRNSHSSLPSFPSTVTTDPLTEIFTPSGIATGLFPIRDIVCSSFGRVSYLPNLTEHFATELTLAGFPVTNYTT